MHQPTTLALAAALALAVPAAAAAQTPSYPPPSNPGSVQKKPKGPFRTLTVGKQDARYKTIQSAVNAARPGDRVKVKAGTYREAVRVSGARKRFIKIIGDVNNPQRVVLEGSGRRQNGVTINGADGVTLRGLKARRYRANGFFAVNVTGYAMDRLIAELPGTYGLYAFNSKGGSMTNSLSYLAADGSYYVGQTPKQTRPLRTIIRNVVGWGSVIGYTGTNSRYVTITRSFFFNNAVGLAPNSLDSEKFPPNEENVFAGNDVFWNNFDVYAGKPPYKPNAAEQFVYPPGVGAILLSGRDNQLDGNRIYGNHLTGLAVAQNPFLKSPADQLMERNRFTGNAFGLEGLDKNGRDIVATGNGSDNCYSGNTGVESSTPGPEGLPACPFSGKNPESQEAFNMLADWAVAKNYRKGWVPQPHAQRQDSIVPIDGEWRTGANFGPREL